MKVKILNVKIVKGYDCYSGWNDDMQKVMTDQGEYIDDIPKNRNGHNWKNEIGHYIDVHINNTKGGNKWINFKKRLSGDNEDEGFNLQEGTKYSLAALNDIFGFKYKKGAGIKKAKSGDMVLFSNREGETGGYRDIWDGDSLDFEGQNTGPGVQELIFGNQDLYDLYHIPNSKDIYLFKDYIYKGKYLFNAEPYEDELNGTWRFSLIKE